MSFIEGSAQSHMLTNYKYGNQAFLNLDVVFGTHSSFSNIPSKLHCFPLIFHYVLPNQTQYKVLEERPMLSREWIQILLLVILGLFSVVGFSGFKLEIAKSIEL